jgi:outer membrane protein OmpA-like peptidoglycan-associated protein
MRKKDVLTCSIFVAIIACCVPAALAKDYVDSRGKKVVLPLGDASFADEVVSFEKGRPAARDVDSQPGDALGPPNYDKNNKKAKNVVSLGCGGTLTLRFTDNALVDIDGPDLFVFEVGPDIEPTDLSISVDGTQWVHVGKIAGGRADVDIASVSHPGDAYHFVRLIDLKKGCGSSFPGADIDAVAAIGTGLVISLNTSVMFDVDRSAIKTEASRALAEAAEKIKKYPGAKIIVDGHTDSTGSDEHNKVLSEKRAQAVRDSLLSLGAFAAANVQIHGYGESRPIAPNDTDAGRERNRRVEVIILPRSDERR